jgi:hypothetical protein
MSPQQRSVGHGYGDNGQCRCHGKLIGVRRAHEYVLKVGYAWCNDLKGAGEGAPTVSTTDEYGRDATSEQSDGPYVDHGPCIRRLTFAVDGVANDPVPALVIREPTLGREEFAFERRPRAPMRRRRLSRVKRTGLARLEHAGNESLIWWGLDVPIACRARGPTALDADRARADRAQRGRRLGPTLVRGRCTSGLGRARERMHQGSGRGRASAGCAFGTVGIE